MSRSLHLGPLPVAILGLLLLTGRSLGEPPADKTVSEKLSSTLVETRLKQLDEAKDLDEATKSRLRELYQQTITELDLAAARTAKAAEFEQMAKSAPSDLQKAKAELAASPKPAAIPADLTLPQFEQEISKKETALSEASAALAKSEADPKNRTSRRAKIPQAISAAKEQVAEIERQLQAAPLADELPQLVKARRSLLAARKRVLLAEIASCQQEIAAYDATTELLPINRDCKARQVARAEQEIKQWREVLNQRREREAEKQVQRARREAAEAHPAVRKLAQDNAELAEMRKDLAPRIAETTQQLDESHQTLAALKEQFKRVQEKVDAAGLSNAIGLLLRKQRETLPNLRSYRHNMAARQTAIRDWQLVLLQLWDRRSELANLEVRARSIHANLDCSNEPGGQCELEAAVRELLKTQKEYLDAAIADHNSHFEKLVELENAERQLIQETENCQRYIDERVLWIASARVLDFSDLRSAGDALWGLARPEGWREVGRALAADARNNPLVPILAVLVGATLLWCRRRMRSRIRLIGEQAAKANCYRFLPTLQTLALTVLLSLTVPGLLGYAAWRLSADVDASEWCKAVGAGLAGMARVYLLLEFLRRICHPYGLAEAHFAWNTASLKTLRRQAKWLLAACLPLAFLVAVMGAQENDRWRDSLGRMSFMAAAIVFSLFTQRTFRPGGSVAEAVLAARRGGWLDRLRYVWYPLMVSYPIVLAGLAAAGYYYTSQHLARRIFFTISLALGVLIVRALLLRWALVNRRKLAIEQARQRRAAQAEAGETAGNGGLPVPDPDCDLATINSQTLRLLEYSLAMAGLLALWCAWVDVLPALRIFQRIQVWQTGLTLADLGLAVLVLATTLIAGKNLPGLLEMGLLRHLPLDSGVRYAVSTISRYAITVLGLVAACSLVGLSWSKVQWLLAAISLGMGFGLQEIFANFISGLIILFERPIRVGDVVTVDNTTGVVSRIRIRATTITNWDRKELIIPNKEFITGRVLNWTLTDQVNRVVINVGVAYGSDTERAAELLMQVAREHPLVLDDPPPSVALESFGDSSLGFVLRCFLPNLDSRTPVIHELHMAVERAFRAAGVEIAFPQQDIHVRTIDVAPQLLQAVVGGGSGTLQVAGQDAANKRPQRQVA